MDLYEFDSDGIKTKLLIEYKDKLSELCSKRIIDYVNDNIDNSLLRNKVFLFYKDYLCKQSDDDFIYFIESFSEINLKYPSDTDKEITKTKLVVFIINNYTERLHDIKTELLPQLFSSSAACLQHEYINVLKDSIEKLIAEKTYIKNLLSSAWGDSKKEILTTYKEQFKSLNAEDWYKLHDVLNAINYDLVDDLLLTCDIDNFDFIDKGQLLSNNSAKRMFYYFERNIQIKLFDKYNNLAENNNTDELMKIYDELMTKIVDEDSDNVLTDYNCINLLVLLRVLFKHNIINDKDEYYLLFKDMYMNKVLD